LQSQNFPSLIERSASDFPSPKELGREVCRSRYWAALFTFQGASARLHSALAGGTAAQSYNKSEVIAFVWNEARYSATIDSTVANNLQTLASAARIAYGASNSTEMMQGVSATDTVATSILIDPWRLVSLNIQPTQQGSRLIYNSLVIVLILIQEFFYLATINSLYVQFKIYERLYPHRIIIFRNIISGVYTFIGSLCTTGAIWAFAPDWNVNGNQFALTWVTLWLFAHLNFNTLDFFTIWLPPPYVPMSLISWIVFNVTSILVPFDLSPRFYRWAYAMPAHEVYQTLVDIWSRGCNPRLHIALPILFAWELLGLCFSALGVYRRCHYAVLAAEAQENAFRSRVEAAVAFERKHEKERKVVGTAQAEEKHDVIEPIKAEEPEESDKEAEELADAIRREDENLRKVQTKSSRSMAFGPSFELAFE